MVGLDGSYVHSSEQRSRRDGWLEVVAGKSMPTAGPSKCFGFVQTYDKKPKRRMFEVLSSQNMQANQAVTFITDGGADIRDLPLYLNPDVEHLLDWFHVTMRLTVMANMAKSLPPELVAGVAEQLSRLKWFCRHGNVPRAVQTIDDLVFDLDIDDPKPGRAKLLKAVTEFGTTFAPTPNRSPTTANATAPVNPSPAHSSSQPSTR